MMIMLKECLKRYSSKNVPNDPISLSHLGLINLSIQQQILSTNVVNGQNFIFLNDNNPISMEPGEVSSQSSIFIQKMIVENDYTNNPLENPLSIQAGDCFQFQFQQIISYNTNNYSYAPLQANQTLDCSQISPQVSCQVTSQWSFNMTVNDPAAANKYINENGFNGNILNVTVPFSRASFQFQQIQFYKNCQILQATSKSGDPTLQKTGNFIQIQNPTQFVNFKTFSMNSSNNVLGYSGGDNILTISLTPTTLLPLNGGQFTIQSLTKYYQSLLIQKGLTCPQALYATSCMQCTSSRFQGILGSQIGDTYTITYASLTGKQTDPITIQCSPFYNPITPNLTSLIFSSTDLSGNVIEQDSFLFDSTGFVPMSIINSQITTQLTTNKIVLQPTIYQFSFKTPISLEIYGCYMEIIFPPEIILGSTMQVNGTAATSNSSKTAPIFNYFNQTPQYTYNPQNRQLIIQGCVWQPPAKPPTGTFVPTFSTQPQNINLFIGTLTNPFSQRSTSPFSITVYAKYLNDTTQKLSNPLIQTLTYVIQQQQYQTNIINTLLLSASNPIVQETTSFNITFNTTTRLAGSNSNMLQAIHIRMPNTFSYAENNQGTIFGGGQNINLITSQTNTTVDQTSTYNADCQTVTCFLIQFSYTDILPSQLIVQISNVVNPLSIATAGNITISTMTKTSVDVIFYKTDSSSIITNYQAQYGTIIPSTMFLTTVPENSQSQTYSDNQVLNITFTLNHNTTQGGYIKVTVPSTFTMSSISSAIANYIVQDAQLQSYATIYSVNDTTDGPYIIGQLNQFMPPGQNYSIVVGGLRNPRYLINNSLLNSTLKQYWQVSTYDSNGFLDKQNMIDFGKGGLYDVSNLSTISSFYAIASNTTAGVVNAYQLTWVTGVSTQSGDHLFVTFPFETQFVSPYNNQSLNCQSLSIRSLQAASCTFNQSVLIISLDNVTLNTGLYKVQVSSIKNPASVRGSSNFGSIYQTTIDTTQLVASFKQSSSIEIDYAAQLQGLTKLSLVQSSLEYKTEAWHNITFMPYNNLKTSNLTIQVYYPSTVHHKSSTCTITYNNTTTDNSFCSKLPGNKYYQINGSVPAGYFGNITVNLKMENPSDNWGQLGYKIKTFENYSDELYMVDQEQGNNILPNLKCLSPCKQCPNSLSQQAQSYCEECWITNPLRYLQTFSQFNQSDQSGNSTCLSACSDGYTSNGDKKQYKCVQCDQTCLTCQDNGQEGDISKCLKCSPKFPFIYNPLSLCMQSCGDSYYQVTNTSCDKCVSPCQNCVGNKFNCTTCNNNSYLPALFTANYGGQILSTCLSQCPPSYYLDTNNITSQFCGACLSPCQTCQGTSSSCLSCDGSNGRFYNYKLNCYKDCPSRTAPDMNTLNCVDCPSNCNKCGTQGGASCYECVRPWLLEDGECHDRCYNQGYFPNKAGTVCINTIEFPTLGPIFFIISMVFSIAVVIIKYFIKEETVIVPSIIAVVGCIEWIAILFQIYLTSLYNQPKFLGLTLFSFFVLIILNIANYLYIRYKVIDENATATSKLSKKKVKELQEEDKKRKKRKAKYEEAIKRHKQKYQNGGQQNQYKPLQQKESDSKNFKELVDIDDDDNEGGNYEDHWIELQDLKQKNFQQYNLDEMSDPGSSISQKSNEDYEGGSKTDEIILKFFKNIKPKQQDIDKNFLESRNIQQEGDDYFENKNIQDLGYIKWKLAYDRTEEVIRWVSLIISFKFYRMTYSYFMGRKQFLVIYQKKKFKKMLVALTLVSQFFVEVPLIINSVVAMTQIVFGQQLFFTILDTLLLSIFLVVIEFYEISQLDRIMKTINISGHKEKKSAAAHESSEDNELMTSEEEDESDDYPDWKLMLKNVEGNPNLFLTNQKQLKINDLAKKFDPRVALSCIDFNTGTEKEDDPRLVKSFPCSPKEYKEFTGFDYGNFGSRFDNVYAESRAPRERDHGKTFSEMGTQAQPSEILTALARKGGNLLTPGVDNEDYQRRKGIKKKRGRKNKYYKQIDAEDDEEADQMSDGSDDDGLDGIKEEDEEDEEERQAKIAKLKAEAEKKAKEDEEKRIQAAKEELAKRKSAEEQKRKSAEEQKRKSAEEEKRKTAEEQSRKTAEEQKRKALDQEKKEKEEKAQKEIEDLLRKEGQSDVQSELSLLMGKSATLQKFGVQGSQVMEVPPNAENRTFNECDIIGNLDRDEKGNVLANIVDENKGIFKDKDGNLTNQRGYLLEPATGDIVNNMNGKKMFDKKDLDEKGEIPAPFNVEKHNFNPHYCRGNFDYDQNGKPIISKNQRTGNYVDKYGDRVSSRGYRIDAAGNLIDNYKRKKFDKSHMTPDGDLPKFFNYNGRRFDITDIIGQIDKDKQGNLILLTDQHGNFTDNLGRRVNSRGYLIDEFGNVIDKDGRQIFEQKHLKNDEIPKILPFTKFNIKNILGDFEMDPLGNPILDRDSQGNLIDRQGKKVNSKGYLIDSQGNVINKYGKLMFEKILLDNEEDIPKVFRTGLLKSDTASSLSRLMSEIGKNQPSEFDQEEQRIQEEIAQNIRKQKRGNSGNTSVDSMMEDTPANYNFQNQRFDEAGNLLANIEDQEMEEEDDDDDYGSQYEQIMGRTGMTGIGTGGHELAKKKRKKKKKKKKKKIEYEDPSLREHLLAGAYGGVAKPKPKRAGVKYTTDLDAGLRDIATPAMFLRDPSKKMITSFSGFANIAGNVPDSSRGKGKGTNRMKSSQGRSEIGSNIGSKIGGLKKPIGIESTSKLLDPQQREDQLKKEQMDEINRKKALAAAKKKKINAAGRPGKISKDADFEKMFGKDIDEFLEDSEWDIESIDKMSQFSKNSKQTIRSAAQAGKLRGLEKLYLQRIETSMNKNTLNAAQATQVAAGKPQKKKGNKFREFQDRYVDDPQYIARGGEQESSGASPSKNPPQRARQAWDTGSRVSKGSQKQSVKRVFKANN